MHGPDRIRTDVRNAKKKQATIYYKRRPVVLDGVVIACEGSRRG